MPASEPFVTLRDGTAIAVPVLRALWALEARGVRFAVDDDGEHVLAGPASLLSDADRTFIREHRDLVRTVLAAEVYV